MSGTDSKLSAVDVVARGAPSDPASPLVSNQNAGKAVLDETTANSNEFERDPESFTDVAAGNVLVKLAAALLVLLAALALVVALAR